jgi:DNA-binding response OmpR family regulator
MDSPRVLLVEDDPLLRRFVRMALEELPLELLECDGVAPALDILSRTQVQLIITDLMLSGASGIDLLQSLQRTPCLRGQAKTMVLSAGLTPEMREKLAPLNVWQMLSKPVSLQLLEDYVMQALHSVERNDPAAPFQAQAPDLPDDKHAADTYFAGDLELFHSYRAACMLQFPHDIRAGDAACTPLDLAALRRIAHSLKSVLQTLGYAELSKQARALEDICHTGQTELALQGWSGLRTQLQALASPA